MNIGITGWGSISALGTTKEQVLQAYKESKTYIHFNHPLECLTASLSKKGEEAVHRIKTHHKAYKALDRSVLLSIYATEQAYQQAGWIGKAAGINMGSSRGATEYLESSMQQFFEENTVPVLSSPSTSLGNISSWTAFHLGQTEGITMSHSITCSTALHSIANAVVWLESGRSTQFLAGGTEAALTPFTVAQMKALRIYSTMEGAYPCLSLDEEKTQNTMVLGEGAACFALEKEAQNSLATIVGMGYATEQIRTATSLSKTGDCLQKSMQMAIAEAGHPTIDAIVCHAPGTIQGDASELAAIRTIFTPKNMPLLTSNKWKVGHTFGASGALSMEMALLMLETQQFVSVPYLPQQEKEDRPLSHILVNAVGFGGNAVSIVLAR